MEICETKKHYDVYPIGITVKNLQTTECVMQHLHLRQAELGNLIWLHVLIQSMDSEQLIQLHLILEDNNHVYNSMEKVYTQLMRNYRSCKRKRS